MRLTRRVEQLEAALVSRTSSIPAWCTLEGEPVAPPAAVVEQVEAEASALVVPGAWRCAVWLPDDALAFLVGEGADELQVIEL